MYIFKHIGLFLFVLFMYPVYMILLGIHGPITVPQVYSVDLIADAFSYIYWGLVAITGLVAVISFIQTIEVEE